MFFFYLTIQASCYHHFQWLQTQVAGLTGHQPRSFGPSRAGIPSLGPRSPGHCTGPGGSFGSPAKGMQSLYSFGRVVFWREGTHLSPVAPKVPYPKRLTQASAQVFTLTAAHQGPTWYKDDPQTWPLTKRGPEFDLRVPTPLRPWQREQQEVSLRAGLGKRWPGPSTRCPPAPPGPTQLGVSAPVFPENRALCPVVIDIYFLHWGKSLQLSSSHHRRQQFLSPFTRSLRCPHEAPDCSSRFPPAASAASRPGAVSRCPGPRGAGRPVFFPGCAPRCFVTKN